MKKTKEQKNKIKGITLIALVITVIVLLLLAGVSITMLTGNNGILNKAQEASEKTKFASEKEAVELVLTEMKMNNYLGEESKTSIGKELYDRNVKNGERWDVVVEKETGRTYGTGCTYIPKGSDLGNGNKTKLNWLIDKDGNLKELTEGSFTELDYSSTVGAVDGLILNMDSTNFEEGKPNWGDNITLRYFDDVTYNTVGKRQEAYNQQVNDYVSVSENDNGYDRLIAKESNEYFDSENKAFKFKGNNYIEIYNKEGFDFSEGLTFEFYGKLSKNVNYMTMPVTHIGLLGIWNGSYSNPQDTGFSVLQDRSAILHCLLVNYREESVCGQFIDSNGDYPFNQVISYKDSDIDLDNDIYISISINPNGDENTGIQSIYINNKCIGEGWLSKKYYNYFAEYIKSSKYIEIGRVVFGNASNWCYQKGEGYAIRLYNKALSKKEIQTNYDKTIAYHELLKRGNQN